MSLRIVVCVFCILLISVGVSADERQEFESLNGRFAVEVVVSGLKHPWGMAFVSADEILVTERGGDLRLIENGRLEPRPVSGLPKIAGNSGQGGLLDIALDPNFSANRRLCISYAAEGEGGRGTDIACGQYQGGEIQNIQVIFRSSPKSDSGRHFGSRLVFAGGYLFATLGDRGIRPQAQDVTAHPGSVIRLFEDGSVPSDNPFVTTPGAKPEIFTLGNRNPQGLVVHPVTGDLWMHEHGPRGGDELNRVIRGANYGWPVISYGQEYFLPKAVGEGTHKEGMEQPLHYWVPSIAPSGMAFYTGQDFPQWQGNLFIGSLKFQELVRLELQNGKVVTDERLLGREYGRIRDVRMGPDGHLYFLTDSPDAQLLKIVPVD